MWILSNVLCVDWHSRLHSQPSQPTDKTVLNAIRAAAREATYVIVSFHWGDRVH